MTAIGQKPTVTNDCTDDVRNVSARSRGRKLTCYCDDGPIEINNNADERALRGMALGRSNLLFMASDAGGERATAIYGPDDAAKLGELDPQATQRASRGP